MITKIIDGLYGTDWTKVYEVRKEGCYCLSLTTDLESYLEVEGCEEECVDEFIKELKSSNLIYDYTVYNKQEKRLKRGKVDEA